jgi:hypothetical protein
MYTSSPSLISGPAVAGVVGIDESLVISLRGSKKAMPKSFSVGFVTEAASLTVILRCLSNFVNLIEFEKKLMICKAESAPIDCHDYDEHIKY